LPKPGNSGGIGLGLSIACQDIEAPLANALDGEGLIVEILLPLSFASTPKPRDDPAYRETAMLLAQLFLDALTTLCYLASLEMEMIAVQSYDHFSL